MGTHSCISSDEKLTMTKTKQEGGKKRRIALVPKKLDLITGGEESVIGMRIAKDLYGSIHFGTVRKYCTENKYWHVLFDDGDSEEFGRQEIRYLISKCEKITSQSYKHEISNPNTSVSRKRKRAKVSVVTP